ncbi:MAG: IS66 family transposase [Treponema sp.]|jgi:transposase|nr:IS66 family transposase [Treponema sp.]
MLIADARKKMSFSDLGTLVENQKKEINKLENTIKRLEFKNIVLQEKYDLLLYKRFVRSSEIPDKTQPELFDEAQAESGTGKQDERETETITYQRNKHKAGRKPLPENLTREERINDLPEEEKTCGCGRRLERIGEDVNEKLIIEEPRIYVERTVTPKYVCPCCKGGKEDGDAPCVIKQAQAVPSILPGSIASPGVLARIFTAKFEERLPYSRQEKQFERIGAGVSRQDMANWQGKTGIILISLYVLLKQTLKEGKALRMDETTVQVMGEEDRKDTQKSYMRLARGGPPGKPVVIYKYSNSRKAGNIDEFIEGFRGYLQTDGYAGYDSAVRGREDIIHVGCFAHARRKFIEGQKAGVQAKSAAVGINYIKQLYDIDGELREKLRRDEVDENNFLTQRKERTEAVLGKFRKYLDKRIGEVPGETLLGKAVSYTVNQWEKLTAYLECAELTPDNNISENAIRPFVVGRKNWLFYKIPVGAETACILYSVIETAKLNGLSPLKYLKTLFERIPYAVSPDDWIALLPWNISL